MKILKFLFITILLAVFAFAAWVYYPQYQLSKLKSKGTEERNMTTINTQSYLEYYKDSAKTQLNHLALGDSIIKGYGVSPDQNLVSHFSYSLENSIQKPVTFQNEGINGITSSTLHSLITEGSYNEAIKKADIVTINIGGNDILKMAASAGNRDMLSALKSFDELQSTFSNNLTGISKYITELNPDATILFLELYNPLPEKSPFYSLGTKLLPQWNLMIYQISSEIPSSLVVETTRVINNQNLNYLSPDGIHPNSSGYSAISEQMMYQFENNNSPV
ncbi:lysophospholipase L1-like esterase [Peribacillus deserti]|uniref:Lysophospholipase L1-like esterase n=1 Tax=Peribacillus deserti TaxID=673318 RepID=A0ABS2QMZ5_9BACI|nr:GDSL-type esterase/lipase family protein [Peribacillus deserti]MBM7694533.1 lysophospholipase L1-like esterase [Peribacillus deserti]